MPKGKATSHNEPENESSVWTWNGVVCDQRYEFGSLESIGTLSYSKDDNKPGKWFDLKFEARSSENSAIASIMSQFFNGSRKCTVMSHRCLTPIPSDHPSVPGKPTDSDVTKIFAVPSSKAEFKPDEYPPAIYFLARCGDGKPSVMISTKDVHKPSTNERSTKIYPRAELEERYRINTAKAEQSQLRRSRRQVQDPPLVVWDRYHYQWFDDPVLLTFHSDDSGNPTIDLTTVGSGERTVLLALMEHEIGDEKQIGDHRFCVEAARMTLVYLKGETTGLLESVSDHI